MSYELTERGKIIIAIVFVLLLLVLPAVILGYNAWANQAPPPDDSPQASAKIPGQNGEPQGTENGPLPEGSGFNPEGDDYPENGNGESGTHNSGDQIPPNTDFGLIGVDSIAGTLSFYFSPEMQNTLDAGTISKISEFLSSPKNRIGSQIAVEMPVLSNEDAAKLMTAIGNAFAPHGVSQAHLVYLTYPSDTVGSSFEVKLSFIQTPRPK